MALVIIVYQSSSLSTSIYTSIYIYLPSYHGLCFSSSLPCFFLCISLDPATLQVYNHLMASFARRPVLPILHRTQTTPSAHAYVLAHCLPATLSALARPPNPNSTILINSGFPVSCAASLADGFVLGASLGCLYGMQHKSQQLAIVRYFDTHVYFTLPLLSLSLTFFFCLFALFLLLHTLLT